MKHNTALEAKVEARNKVNAQVLKYVPVLIDILTPFVGEKVQNVTGFLSKKVVDEINGNMPTDQNVVHYWIECTNYSIRAHFKTCESYPSRHPGTDIAVYAESSFTVGELESFSGVLKQTNAHPLPEYWRTDYSVNEVKRLRIEAEVFRKHLQNVESKLSRFGEYD